MGIIETLALIAIIIGALKFLSLLLAPKQTIEKGKKLAEYPGTLMIVCVVLAAVVLYYLLQAGMTIVHILAVMLFSNLIVGIALAKYAKVLYKSLNPKTLLKEQWVFLIVFLVLIVWGIKELFF